MKIILVTDDLRTGGVQKFAVLVANTFAADGHDVSLIAGSEGRMWADLDESVAAVRIPFHGALRFRLAVARQLMRQMRDGRVDVIHSQQRGVALIASIVSGRRTTTVEHVHNVSFSSRSWRRLSFRSDRILACGSAVERMLLDKYELDKGKVACVLNGVPDSGQSDPPVAVSPRSVVAIGRLSPQKDPLRFVELIGALRDMGVDLTAVWVGDGELRREVENRIRDLSLDTVVRLAGDVNDVAPWIARSHVVVSTSGYEGLPLTALEALSVGRALMLPDVGSCSDAVQQDVNGILYDPMSPLGDLAGLLSDLLADGERITSFGHASRSLYEERFTLQRMVRTLAEQYAIARST